MPDAACGVGGGVGPVRVVGQRQRASVRAGLLACLLDVVDEDPAPPPELAPAAAPCAGVLPGPSCGESRSHRPVTSAPVTTAARTAVTIRRRDHGPRSRRQGAWRGRGGEPAASGTSTSAPRATCGPGSGTCGPTTEDVTRRSRFAAMDRRFAGVQAPFPRTLATQPAQILTTGIEALARDDAPAVCKSRMAGYLRAAARRRRASEVRVCGVGRSRCDGATRGRHGLFEAVRRFWRAATAWTR